MQDFNTKMKMLYLIKIMEQTDEENAVTMAEIIKKLDGYGIHAERKSIYSDLRALRLSGKDIVRAKKGTNGYYMGHRAFEVAEFKLMVDAVQSAGFITQQKAAELTKKLESLTSPGQAKKLAREVYVPYRMKSMDGAVYNNVEQVHRAIAENKQITFNYYEYTVAEDLRFRRNGEVCVVSPYLLSIWDDHYFMVAYRECSGDLAHFRVDKMGHICLLDHPGTASGLDAVGYTNRTIIFSEKPEWIEIEFDNRLVGTVIDKFGQNAFLEDVGPGTFTISINITANPAFYAWVFQLGEKARIITPQSIVDKIKEFVDAVSRQYEGTVRTLGYRMDYREDTDTRKDEIRH